VDYDKYIKSMEWLIKSKVFIGRRGYRCEKCGASSEQKQLFTHHKHYRTLGHEKDEDVEVLCFDCHKKADRKRTSGHDKYWKGFESWVVSCYGKDWRHVVGEGAARKEFDRYIGLKREHDY
jgi:hypothetical protein